jgi:ribosomal protein L11 methyltransferase
VSDHLVIKPPLVSLNLPSGQRAVSLQRGASFGGGEHPTTRLAIRLIDVILHTPPWTVNKQTCRGIDIGTGSGILAISAAAMGLGFVCGIDTDPCALFEAHKNVGLNHLENRVHISNDRLDDVVGPYDVILANLRAPTLMTLRDNVMAWLSDPCVLILSGLKTEEIPLICDYYREAGFIGLRKLSENSWSAICLVRGAF